MTRIVAISDTHCKHEQLTIPDGDILIHAGDFSNRGTHSEFEQFAIWYDSLKDRFKYRIVLPGNHDRYCEDNLSYCKERLGDARFVHSGLVFAGDEDLRILCYSWTTEIYPNSWWKFTDSRLSDRFARFWDNAPNCDILVTHGPPQGILDRVKYHEANEDPHVGEWNCKQYVEREKPILHIFGHIHEAYGQTSNEHTRFFNVSNCDLDYNPINPVTVIDL